MTAYEVVRAQPGPPKDPVKEETMMLVFVRGRRTCQSAAGRMHFGMPLRQLCKCRVALKACKEHCARHSRQGRHTTQ